MNKMLPIIGVGSAAAIVGLIARRRSTSPAASSPAPRQRPSGIVARQQDAAPPSDELQTGPISLPREFWDAVPESELLADDIAPGSLRREPSDADDLTADWLARATQTAALDDTAVEDGDDPAEIPADSLSMISDASRHAASPPDDVEVSSERL